MTDTTDTAELSTEELNALRRQILRARNDEDEFPPPDKLKAALATLRRNRAGVQESAPAVKRAKKAELHSKPLSEILSLDKK